MNIKILRLECTMCPHEPGCSVCDHIGETVKEVVKELDVDAKIEEIRDIEEIIKYPVRGCCHFDTPALVLNEKVVCSRRVPDKAEVTTFITTALENEKKPR